MIFPEESIMYKKRGKFHGNQFKTYTFYKKSNYKI